LDASVPVEAAPVENSEIVIAVPFLVIPVRYFKDAPDSAPRPWLDVVKNL
jgi:hypothetical protein